MIDYTHNMKHLVKGDLRGTFTTRDTCGRSMHSHNAPLTGASRIGGQRSKLLNPSSLRPHRMLRKRALSALVVSAK